MVSRCQWAGDDPLMVAYHDTEWGVPVWDDQKLFEFLVLEGMQAGLSWQTILRKRENYRRAFHNFDPWKIARYGDVKVAQLMSDPGIIRNKRKIDAVIRNARAFLIVRDRQGSFSNYVWSFVNDEPKRNHWRTLSEIPASTPESQAMSKDLRHRGFQFVGPTICYAFMQAVGMVNDHLVDCFRYVELGKEATRRDAARLGVNLQQL